MEHPLSVKRPWIWHPQDKQLVISTYWSCVIKWKRNVLLVNKLKVRFYTKKDLKNKSMDVLPTGLGIAYFYFPFG